MSRPAIPRAAASRPPVACSDDARRPATAAALGDVATSASASTIVAADGRSLPRCRRRGHRRQRRARPSGDRRRHGRPGGRLAYAHGSAFTTEPRRGVRRRDRAAAAAGRSGHLPGQRRVRGDRDRPEAGPRVPPGPWRDRSTDASSPGGGATTATPSARSTCPGAGRCAARTNRGSAGSATCPRPIRTAPAIPARTPWPTGRSWPRSSTRTIEAAGPRTRRGVRGRADRRGDAGRGRAPGRLLAGHRRGLPPARRAAHRRRGDDRVRADRAWFALDHWGVRPDLLVAAKGASSGYWPFGFVAMSGRVHDAVTAPGAGFVHGFTYSHAPVGAAVARAVLRILRDEDLVAASAAKGDRLAALLREPPRRAAGRRRDPRPRPAAVGSSSWPIARRAVRSRVPPA